MHKFECELCGKCCTPLSLSLYPWENYLFENLSRVDFKFEFAPEFRIQFNDLEVQGDFAVNGDIPCPYLEGNLCKIHQIKPISCKAAPMKYEITLLHDFPTLRGYSLSYSSNCCGGAWGKAMLDPYVLSGKQEMVDYSCIFPVDIQKWAAVNARLNAIENITVTGLLYLGGAIDLGTFDNTQGGLKGIDVFQYLVETKILPVEFKQNIKNLSVDALIIFLNDCYKFMQTNWVASYGQNGFIFKQ